MLVTVLVVPRKLGGWHKHIHVEDDYMTGCWKSECWDDPNAIKMTGEDLELERA